MSAPAPGPAEKKDAATKEVEMKENGEATSTAATSSTTPRPSTTPSTPATGNKRKRNDDDGEGEIEDELPEDSNLDESPDSEERKGSKRMKMPEAEDAKTGKGKKVAVRKGSLEGEGSVYKLLQGIVEPLGELKKSLRTGSTAVSSLLGAIAGQTPAVAGTSSSKSAGAFQLYIWGKLVAQQPKNMAMSVSLSGPSFSIGGNSRCSLTISDPGIGSSVVCKLHNSITTGVVQIEGQTSRNILFVNLKPLKKGVKQPIKTGDEITIMTKQQTYAFTFQKVRSPSKQTSPAPGALPSLPSLSLLAGAGGGHPHLSLSGLAPPHGLGFSTSTSTSTSTSPSSTTSSSSSSSSQAAATSSSSSSSSGGSAQQPAPETPDASASPAPHDVFSLGNLPMAFSLHRGADLRRRAAARNKRPSRILTVKGGEVFGDHSPLGHPRSLILTAGFGGDSSTAGSSSSAAQLATAAAQKKACKEDLAKSFVKWQDIATSFEDFPYFIDNDTKEMLLNSAFVFIKKPELVKHITDIPSISRRMLLAGPPGSEIYQEMLVKALARHLQANLFVFEGFKPVEPPAKATSAAATPAAAGSAAPATAAAETKDTAAATAENAKPAEETAADAKAAETAAPTTTEVKEAANLPTLGSALSLASAISELLSSAASAAPGAGASGHDHMDDEDAEVEGGVDEDEADGDLEADMDAFDDMDDDEDSDADDDDDADGDAWFGKRNSDITKSRRTRFGPLGLGTGYFSDGLHSRLHNEERDSQEKANVEALFELVTAEENTPCILYLKDTEKTLLTSYERYAHFRRQLDKVTTPLVVIGSSIVSTKGKGDKAPGGGFLLSKSGGQTTLLDFALFDHISRMEERARDTSKGARILSRLLPNKITVNPPKDGPELPKWTKQITKDQQDMKQQQNRAAIRKVLEKNNIAIVGGEEGLRSRPLREQVFTGDKVEKIVGWAVGHHLITSEQKGQEVQLDGTKLMLPATAIDHGIRMLNRIQPATTKTSLKDVQTDNDFERKLLAEAIPPNELAVRFEDIGALDKVKNTLKELVMLPLQRPELFRKGNLTKPCKGILLFGPPGTGKTMLAKAVATESGANFINCSMSSIGSKWFGEGEKYARAVFTLASKISPCVVFIDEVDSILGSREKSGEHEAMRKIKNEFMSMWDGLKTKENERVIVMAATNRPFDLDDAVLRRMPRRLLVDLPDAENRQKILRVILAKEDLEPDFDFKAVGEMTEGFSGSDLKNLCISAAYMPIREIIEQEKKEGKEMDLTKKKKGKEKADAMEEEDDEEEEEENPEEREPPVIRALGMEDFVKAKKENSASVHEDARAVGELRKWNEMYGEGGNARGKDLSYFL